MNKKTWYALWGILYIICAALGFVSEAEGGLKAILILLALLFFVPPAVLLYDAIKRKDLREVRRIRNLSLLSLIATLVLMVLNILSVLQGSEALGDTLYAILVLVSSPMYCARNGFLSLFRWACLLMVSMRFNQKNK